MLIFDLFLLVNFDLEKNNFSETVCSKCSHVQELQRFENAIAFNDA